MKYLWTEDTGAGLHFWELANEVLFHNEFTVESKENNQGILDAVRSLVPKSKDIYYIAFDQVYDNMDIVNKWIELKQLAKRYPKQIILLDMICFEYLILSFSKVLLWTGSGNQTSIKFREEILKAMHHHRIHIDEIQDTSTLTYLMGFKHFSTERVIKALTNNLTDTDNWNIKGSKLGECWYQDCCTLEDPKKKKCHIDINKGREKLLELFSDKEIKYMLSICK